MKSSAALRGGTLTELVAGETIYTLERLFGDARRVDVPDGLRLELPAESAAIVRISGG